MITGTEPQKKSLEELNECIANAMNRVSAKTETDLRYYLPGKGGYLHHFAFGKLKKTKPAELLKMIKEHIIDRENPEQVSAKPRPAIMVKRTVEVKFKRSQINQILNVLKTSKMEIQGAEELISMLSPHQTLGQVQKLMLDMVRAKEVDIGLWETYMKLVEEERATSPQK